MRPAQSMLGLLLLCLAVYGCGGESKPPADQFPSPSDESKSRAEKLRTQPIVPKAKVEISLDLEEISPQEANPNPDPLGRDSVAINIRDRTTGKVGDLPTSTTQELLEYSLTLDLSQPMDREKVIRKWQQLAGEGAGRHEVTIWAAGKQYRWPHRAK